MDESSRTCLAEASRTIAQAKPHQEVAQYGERRPRAGELENARFGRGESRPEHGREEAGHRCRLGEQDENEVRAQNRGGEATLPQVHRQCQEAEEGGHIHQAEARIE